MMTNMTPALPSIGSVPLRGKWSYESDSDSDNASGDTRIRGAVVVHGDQLLRTTTGALTGASLALAAPLALGITAVSSAAGALISGAQLALSGRAESRSDAPVEALMKVGLASAACAAATLGAGLSALALPLSVPSTALAGAWFNRTVPFSIVQNFVRKGLGFGVSSGGSRSRTASKAGPPRMGPATTQQCSGQRTLQIPAKIPTPIQQVPRATAVQGQEPSTKFPAPAPAQVPARASAPEQRFPESVALKYGPNI